MMMNKILFFFFFVLFAALSIALFSFAQLHEFLSSQGFHSDDETSDKVIVTIETGMSVRRISTLLHEQKIIPNPHLFIWVWRLLYASHPIQAGEYEFLPEEKPADILRKLTSGGVILHSVTIPEGWERKQITRLISEKFSLSLDRLNDLTVTGTNLLPDGLIVTDLEGFLFPDTYLFPRTVQENIIIQTMVRKFFSVFTDTWKSRAEEIGLSMLEVVTLASLIEKETGVGDERALIASVYHNRLKKKMRLQCDPTVIYGLPDFDGNLTKKDLEYDSPYNTYKYAGLPPGPICSPGKGALEAALYPESTLFLYFVAKGDKSGRHVFSKTLAEHNRAVYKEQILPIRQRKKGSH